MDVLGNFIETNRSPVGCRECFVSGCRPRKRPWMRCRMVQVLTVSVVFSIRGSISSIVNAEDLAEPFSEHELPQRAKCQCIRYLTLPPDLALESWLFITINSTLKALDVHSENAWNYRQMNTKQRDELDRLNAYRWSVYNRVTALRPAVLKDHGINISMDGRGRWMDNVFIERLWRSLKYEEVYLKAYM